MTSRQNRVRQSDFSNLLNYMETCSKEHAPDRKHVFETNIAWPTHTVRCLPMLLNHLRAHPKGGGLIKNKNIRYNRNIHFHINSWLMLICHDLPCSQCKVPVQDQAEHISKQQPAQSIPRLGQWCQRHPGKSRCTEWERRFYLHWHSRHGSMQIYHETSLCLRLRCWGC